MRPIPDNRLNIYGRILNFVIVFALSISIIFAPFSILYHAVRGDQKKWFKLFFIFAATYYIAAFCAIQFKDNDTFAAILLLLWLSMMTTSLILLPKLNNILSARPRQVVPPIPPAPPEIEKVETNSLLISTGIRFIVKLKVLQHVVEDDKLKENIQQLIELSEIVLKRNDDQIESFFLRYSDKLISMLNKYDEIENTKLNSPDILQTMQHIRDSVEQIVVAFRNEIANMYKLDLIDINADTMVFIQTLRVKGLIDQKQIK